MRMTKQRPTIPVPSTIVYGHHPMRSTAQWSLWTATATLLLLCSCKAEVLSGPLPFSDNFNRTALGKLWKSQNPDWRITDGELFNNGAHNVPLFLDFNLPNDVELTFTARSESPAVDLKFEIFTDGAEHQSGYVVIVGGWNNSKSIIARLNEHGPERSRLQNITLHKKAMSMTASEKSGYADSTDIVARPFHGLKGKTYNFRLRRVQGNIDFFVNDVLHLSYFDPTPLMGRDNNRFAFNNWASEVYFDDLNIRLP